jgi:hypothetical protein
MIMQKEIFVTDGCGMAPHNVSHIVSLAHCQAWIFIGTYEFRMIFFPRAWLSVGKAYLRARW